MQYPLIIVSEVLKLLKTSFQFSLYRVPEIWLAAAKSVFIDFFCTSTVCRLLIKKCILSCVPRTFFFSLLKYHKWSCCFSCIEVCELCVEIQFNVCFAASLQPSMQICGLLWTTVLIMTSSDAAWFTSTGSSTQKDRERRGR